MSPGWWHPPPEATTSAPRGIQRRHRGGDASGGELDGGRDAVGARHARVELPGVGVAEPLAAGALGRRRREEGVAQQLGEHAPRPAALARR